jgi:hypothetical protein
VVNSRVRVLKRFKAEVKLASAQNNGAFATRANSK